MSSVWKYVFIACSIFAWINASAAPLRGCAAEVEYPPYLFSIHSNSVDARPLLTGFAIDLLQLALSRSGRAPATVERLPWVRCLKMAQSGEIDIVLNVPTAQIDPKPFWITEPYATLHSVYFYSRKAHPKGIHIKDLQELNQYSLCGLMGNSYEAYGIDSHKVDTGARDYVALLKKLEAGFCDLFLEKREVMDGLSAQNPDLRQVLASPELVRGDLPEDILPGLHFAVSRRVPDGLLLQQSLDDVIRQLQAKKEMDRMLRPYLYPN